VAITSEVQICNNALIEVGAQTISALSDTTERARICNEQYFKIRNELLYAHPWNFALKRAELASTVTEPEFEWDTEFTLPSDCLRVLDTDLYKDMDYQIEGRFLYANTDAIKIKYIAEIADVTKFTPGFAECLSLKLAASICYRLTQNATLKESIEAKFERRLKVVRTFDAQEGVGSRIYADSWLNSRF
jgi:hypothetical protein